jgi:aspartyl-tRNA(Asn)/glutamyl-tRNA(Gln) amidotransferase subunit C
VRHLAELSAIKLTDDELKPLAHDIDNIVGYINMLDELDTDGVEPTFQLTGLQNVWREDEVKQNLTREQLLALAPESEDNQVKVPKVL